MSRVFADTFYFLALLNPKDAAHARATAFTLAFEGEMTTTAWVLTELADALAQPANRIKFLATMDQLQTNPQAHVVLPDPVLFMEGIELFKARPDKEWSLTDCISFVVMRKEGISEAL
jgi:predicted nucleic acid-binding protein